MIIAKYLKIDHYHLLMSLLSISINNNLDIVRYLNIKEICNILLCSKSLNDLKNEKLVIFIIKTFNDFMSSKKKLKNNIPINFYRFIRRIYGNNYYLYNNIFNMKYINIGNRCGATGYIDFLRYNDFVDNESNVIGGYDKYNRFFMSILYDKIDLNKGILKNNITTIFQRYSDDMFFYVSCNNSLCDLYTSVNTINLKTLMVNDYYELLFDLLGYGKIEINDNLVCQLTTI